MDSTPRNQRNRGMRGPRKSGVREVAAATGLSVATVSRVLNNAASVRADTRNRVLRAMKELGFAPNPMARALSTRRTRTIAAVIPTLEHSIFARFLNAIELELASRGYALVIATTENDANLELERSRALLDMGAEGLILSGATHREDLLEMIARRDIPTLCTSIFQPDYRLPTIGYDNPHLGRNAINYLQSLGHRRIAVIHGPSGNNDRTATRIEGVRAGTRETDEVTFFETSLDVTGGTIVAQGILESDLGATAILCLSDVLALGALFAGARAGVRIPRDLSVMGFDDLDWAAHCSPPLTTISLPNARMGRKCAAALVARLDDGVELNGERLPADIVVRGTTAAPAADQSRSEASL